MIADLHCHTRLSNGSVGIEEIVMLAEKNGISVIAITDRDCMAGNVRGRIIGSKHDITVLPGVQISCTDRKTRKTADILCYLPDFPDRLEGLCHTNQTLRKKAGLLMASRVAEKFNISTEFILKRSTGSTNCYSQHIMHSLMDAGYTDSIFGDLYERIFDPGSEEYMGINPHFASPQNVLRAIHDAGGIAILSNHAIRENEILIEELLPLGLDGIEVFHPLCSKERRDRLLAYARLNDLLVTGGSDFHGMYNRARTSVGCCGIGEEDLEKFMNYKSKKKKQQKRGESKITNEG